MSRKKQRIKLKYSIHLVYNIYTMLCAVNFIKMIKEKQKQLEELAELIMKSDNLAASVEMLKNFGDKCWQEGACEAQNDAAKYIGENMVHYKDIPNHLFKDSF